MTVELRPMGVTCNIQCTYCYQEPIRDAGNIHTQYSIEKMLAEVERVGREFHVFGGEALLIPKPDLERLWQYGFEKFKHNGVQSNGVLVDDDHIRMFKQYNVSVGISIDGPEELNDARKAGSTLESTREATRKTIANIEKMCKAGVRVGIITCLHKANAGTPEKLAKLKDFFMWLNSIGIRGGNLHLLEVENEAIEKQLCLSPDEEVTVFKDLAGFFLEHKDMLTWEPFSQMPKMLDGREHETTCYWHKCDPLNTQAVYGIEGDGALSNCGRTNKEGVDFYKADGHGYERYIGFYHTPTDMGGCQGCRFWAVCGGSCPGESMNGDWRNKTTHCRTMKEMLAFYEDKLEEQGVVPLTKHPRLRDAEEFILSNLIFGNNHSLSQAIKRVEEMDKRRENEVKVYKEGVRVL